MRNKMNDGAIKDFCVDDTNGVGAEKLNKYMNEGGCRSAADIIQKMWNDDGLSDAEVATYLVILGAAVLHGAGRIAGIKRMSREAESVDKNLSELKKRWS